MNTMNTENGAVTLNNVTPPQEPAEDTLQKVITLLQQAGDALNQDTADAAAVLKLLEAIKGRLEQLHDAGTRVPIWPAVPEGTFGSLIRAARLRKGLSGSLVAEKLGLAPETPALYLVETGRRKLSLDRVPALAQLLDMDAQELTKRALLERHPQAFAALFGTGISLSGWFLELCPAEADTSDPDKNEEADLTSPF